MGINNSQVCLFGTELTATTTGIGNFVSLGTLTQNPVILIFDNQGTLPAVIYVNGTSGSNRWRTFPGGEALILDLRGNHGIASNFTPSLGTTFFVDGAAGTTFSISFVYAQNQ